MEAIDGNVGTRRAAFRALHQGRLTIVLAPTSECIRRISVVLQAVSRLRWEYVAPNIADELTGVEAYGEGEWTFVTASIG